MKHHARRFRPWRREETKHTNPHPAVTPQRAKMGGGRLRKRFFISFAWKRRRILKKRSVPDAGLCPGTRRFALKWTASMPKPLFRPYVRGPFRLYIDFYGSGIFRPWCRAFPGPRFLDPKAPPISRICAGALLAPKGVHQSAETYIMESKPFLAPKGIQYKLPDKWHLPPGNCVHARHRLERKRHPQESGASGHRGAVRRRGMKKGTIRSAGAYDRT